MAEQYSWHHIFNHNLYQAEDVSMAPKQLLSESLTAVTLLQKTVL